MSMSMNAPPRTRRFLPSECPGTRNIGKRKVEFTRNHDYRHNNRSRGRSLKVRKRTCGSDDDDARAWLVSPNDLSSYRDRFVIVSYNILGDDNASKHTDLYEDVEPEDLDWDRRKKRICRELKQYKPSIICLQEVDQFDNLAAVLCKSGFVGAYKGRTGEASDGCAIFWKEKRFILLHEESIEFQKFDLRHNVAQLCVFQMLPRHSSSCRKPSSSIEEMLHTRIFIVCNIHVLFNPNRGDIKLGQMRLLLEKAHILSKKWGNAPVVIAGDLNSMPQSALYRFLSRSELDILSYDRREISVQTEYPSSCLTMNSRYDSKKRYPYPMSKMKSSWSEEEILLAVGKSDAHLQHPLRLSSAYPGVPGNNRTRGKCGEPLATSYHSRFMGTVDYIWHSPELVPVGVLDTLPINILRKTGGLPSQKWGSDHLALVCELAFVDDPNSSDALSDS